MTVEEDPRKRTYYTPREVQAHNSPHDDCWVSFLGLVYDMTPLLKENPGAARPRAILMRPLSPVDVITAAVTMWAQHAAVWLSRQHGLRRVDSTGLAVGGGGGEGSWCGRAVAGGGQQLLTGVTACGRRHAHTGS